MMKLNYKILKEMDKIKGALDKIKVALDIIKGPLDKIKGALEFKNMIYNYGRFHNNPAN